MYVQCCLTLKYYSEKLVQEISTIDFENYKGHIGTV